MNTKKRKLNRGLDALLGTDLTKKAPAGTAKASTIPLGDGDLRQLPLEFLQRGKYQPRIDFDEAALQELADSITAQGVMQPIVVRSLG
ncbi:MAG: ParB N-terminal domain-containing protein, partial [Pseudomonadota bacterium]|nr:ParB N-terminal domain-containing protein [Pseudomonadota bacterium]